MQLSEYINDRLETLKRYKGQNFSIPKSSAHHIKSLLNILRILEVTPKEFFSDPYFIKCDLEIAEPMQFKGNLRYLRKSKNMGQKELADKLNLSCKTISHWETGYSEPSISELILIANYFEIPLDDLLCRN